MAKIYLDPKEDFEHFHNVESSTTLVQGEAVYRSEEKTIILKKGVPVYTPAFKSHNIKNTGHVVCILECGHGVGG